MHYIRITLNWCHQWKCSSSFVLCVCIKCKIDRLIDSHQNYPNSCNICSIQRFLMKKRKANEKAFVLMNFLINRLRFTKRYLKFWAANVVCAHFHLSVSVNQLNDWEMPLYTWLELKETAKSAAPCTCKWIFELIIYLVNQTKQKHKIYKQICLKRLCGNVRNCV